MKWHYKLLLLSLMAACMSRPANDRFYMPAEWEPHDAIWFGWEDADTSFYPVVGEMISKLLPYVPVKIAVSSDSLMRVSKQFLSGYGIDTSGITFYLMPGERYWIRDHGAAFMVNEQGQLAVADFDWNLYGIEKWYMRYYNNNRDSVKARLSKYFNQKTGKVDSLMAVSANAQNIPSEIIIEGGSLEVNGKGTLILSESVTLHRNEGKSKDELEDGFKKALGVSHIIWLKKGLAEDEHITQLQLGKYMTMGTGGHTDEFVRFADPNTILLSWVDEEDTAAHPFNRINYERMKENLEILENAVDQDGKKFTIIKVPLPDLVERTVWVKEKSGYPDPTIVSPKYFLPEQAPAVGDTLTNVAASSYLNYLVTNGAVMLPTYVKHGSSATKEAQVKSIFEKAFPGRDLVWVDCLPLNWNGGGIHCSTQQQPKRKN